MLSATAWSLRDASPAAPRFKTAVLERGPLQASVSATGILNTARQGRISSQVSGQIKELLADFNSQVREGQLIARLDPKTFQCRVRQAAADLTAAMALVLTAQASACWSSSSSSARRR